MIDPTRVSGPAGTRQALPSHLSATGGETTHPSVLHLPQGWNGFTYWMAHTPYPGGDDGAEDPTIVASHDGVTWVTPPGLVNPIDDQPGSPIANSSDVDLRMGPDDTMFLFWRTYVAADTGAEEKLFYSTSTDGRTWSPKTLFHSSSRTVRRLLSPSLLWEGGRWVMWAVEAVSSPYKVVRFEGGATPESGWGPPVLVDMGPMLPGKVPWHLFVTRTSDGYLALLTDTDSGTTGFNDDILLAVSSDGFAFINSGRPVIPRYQAGEHSSLYRATLVPEIVDGVAGWRVWYSAYLLGTPRVWHVYRTWICTEVKTRVATSVETADSSSFTTTETVIDSVTATLVKGRTYRVRWSGGVASTTAGDVVLIRVREDSVTGTNLSERNFHIASASSGGFGMDIEAEYTALADGDQTFAVTGLRNGGTGALNGEGASTRPRFLYVDEVR